MSGKEREEGVDLPLGSCFGCYSKCSGPFSPSASLTLICHSRLQEGAEDASLFCSVFFQRIATFQVKISHKSEERVCRCHSILSPPLVVVLFGSWFPPRDFFVVWKVRKSGKCGQNGKQIFLGKQHVLEGRRQGGGGEGARDIDG